VLPDEVPADFALPEEVPQEVPGEFLVPLDFGHLPNNIL